jgi:hypothetical protein
VALKRAVCLQLLAGGVVAAADDLTAETVQGATLTFQCIDDVHGGDSLPLGVFSVCDSITDDVLKEHFQDTTSFLIDKTADTLDTTTTGQSTDCRLGDTLDVITQHFAMAFRSSFAETFSSLSASSHVELIFLS